MADKLDSRPILVANIETLRGRDFIVLVLFGADGYRVDNIVLPYEGGEYAVKLMRDLLEKYHIASADVWTSTPAVLMAVMKEPGLNGIVKHPSDTVTTANLVAEYEDVLVTYYGLDDLPKDNRRLPKWRRFFIAVLYRAIQKLEGGYDK